MKSFLRSCPIILSICLLAPFFPMQSEVTAEEKPELELPEIVIAASAPLLMKGTKESIHQSGDSSEMSFVSGTVTRSPLGSPEVIDILDAPDLVDRADLKPPCMISFLKLFKGTEGRLQAAQVAFNQGEFEKTIDVLMPIVLDKPDDPAAPAALYFIGRSKQQLRDLSGAANVFDRLRREYSQHRLAEFASYSLGWIYLQNGSLERSTEIIDEFRDKYPNSPLTPYARYLQAATQYAAGQYTTALTTLEGIVAGYPLFPYKSRVQFWIAENKYFNGSSADAEKSYSLYINNFPDDVRIAEARYGRAFCYRNMEQFTEALSDFEYLMNNYPDHPLFIQAAFQAGKICLIGHDSNRAVTYFERVIKAEHPVHTIEARAWIAFESGRFEQAESLFDKAAESAGLDIQADEMHFMKAMAQFQLNKYAESAETFKMIAESGPENFRAISMANAGLALLKLGEFVAASELLAEGLSLDVNLDNKETYMLHQAELLYRMERYQESLDYFKQLTQMDLPLKLGTEAMRGVAWNFYTQKEWKKAAEAFKKLIDRYPDTEYHAEALLRQAECLFNAKQFDAAKAKFQELIKKYPLHPESFEARLLAARIQQVEDNNKGAKATLEEALRYARTGSQRQKVRLLLGDMARDRNGFETASELYKQAYLDDPISAEAPTALLKQANGLYSMEQYGASAEIYRSVIKRFPASSEAVTAQYSIGLTYFQQNRLPEYLDECQKVADQHPGSVQGALALTGAAQILVEQSQNLKAITVYRKLLSQFGKVVDREHIRFRLAQALYRSNQEEEALREYRRIIKDNPHGLFSADAALSLGQHADEAGATEKALEFYLLVIEKFPYHPRFDEALYKAGYLSMSTHDKTHSLNLFTRLVESFPDSKYFFSANLNLGILTMEASQFNDASSYFETARTAPDRNVAVQALYYSARCLEKQGQDESALKSYLKISYLYSDQKDMTFKSLMQAGTLMKSQGKKQDAQRLFEKARGYATRDSDLESVAQALKQLAGS